MKIRRLTIKNVTSYKERTEFIFDNRINILIGPNGGGKSNVQKILALVLSKYFILQYEFKYSDDERKIDPIDLWNRRVLERNLERYIDDPSDQELEIELAPEGSDIENIRTIGSNLVEFNKLLSDYEHQYQLYAPYVHLDAIAAAGSFTYKIHNFVLEEPHRDTPSWGFKEYLREFFIFMRLSTRLSALKLTAPVFFFFSERTFGKKLEVQSTQTTENNYFAGFKSISQAAMGDNTNLLQWGAQHFARLHRRAVNKAAELRDKTAADIFALEPDVQMLTRYMRQLGYEWSFQTDEDSVSYAFVLQKDQHWFTVDKFSSGEKEIVHFLLAMFALNVRDGLVLVDEPELHLHPRWQRIFLGLFRELSPERNNQFVISTHSPVFVTPDTINGITRIYSQPTRGSTRIALRDVVLPDKKNLVRIINSQNNERVFFADKVVLVEGITDRLVLASLLEGTAARFANNEAIEIVEVGGKTNFADYRTLLEALKTRSYIVADKDYLSLVGSSLVKSLFVPDPHKEWDALTKDKKSIDAASMVNALENAIDTSDTSALSTFWAYFKSRHHRLKTPMSDPEKSAVSRDLTTLWSKGTLILEEGEVEDYLPPGVTDVRSIVEMTTNRNWINDVPDESKRVALGRIACAIMGVSQPDKDTLEKELRQCKVKFPLPLSEQLSN